MKKLILNILLFSLIILLFSGCAKESHKSTELTDNNYVIVDKSKEVEDFVCASALDRFYEDENYSYYWSCIKNAYIVVKYENGDEKLVSEALKNNEINIQDLDRFNIKYIEMKK